MPETTDKLITPADIEAKLRQFQAPVDQTADTARSIGVVAGAVIVGVVVIGAYLFGRRKGKKRQTFVEIVRV